MRPGLASPPRSLGAAGRELAAETGEDWERRFESPLPRSFYDRPADELAPDLLGCYLAAKLGSSRRAPVRVVRVVETEAYLRGDPASHAFRGETARNRTMFSGPGHLYVYRIHQVHCANVTARRREGVLMRAGEPATPLLAEPRGPGLLCRALGLEKLHDGIDVVEGVVRVLPRLRPPTLLTTSRVGIRLGRERPLRFLDASSSWISRGRPSAPLPSRSVVRARGA